MNYYDHITNMVTLTRVESKSLSMVDKLDMQKNLARSKNPKLMDAKKISASEMVLGPQRRKSTPNGFEKMGGRNYSDGQKKLDKKYGSQKNLVTSESNPTLADDVLVVEKAPRKLWATAPKRPVSLIEMSSPRLDAPKKADAKQPSPSKRMSLDASPRTPSKVATQKTPPNGADASKKTPSVDARSAEKKKTPSAADASPKAPATPKTPKTPEAKCSEKLANQNRLSKALSDKLESIIGGGAEENGAEGADPKIPIIITTDADGEVEYASDEDNEETDGNLKLQSSPRLSASPSSGTGSGGKPGGSSKARQKKFHRHFQQVAEEERVINYYSCALVSDILLQGHLYITNNYFAFYSNVFGFVTKLLIPTASVLKISKEKTARIIPNAVGVATLDEKHVFGSFMSRDSAHRLMLQVWRAARPTSGSDDNSLVAERDILIQPGDLECSECSADEYSSGSGSGTDQSPPVPIAMPVSGTAASSTGSITSLTCRARALKGAAPAVPTAAGQQANGGSTGANGTSGQMEKRTKTATLLKVLESMPRHTLLLILSTALLVLLFLSAGFLLYRIGQLHDRSPFRGLETPGDNDEVFGEVLRWQAHLRSQSANEVHNMLASHLDQIIKVRRSLESLSMLLASDEAARTKHAGES